MKTVHGIKKRSLFPQVFIFQMHTVLNKTEMLRLKPYSPLAVVLRFTLTQHEDTLWARVDGLKKRERPGEMDQKT